MKVNCHEFYFFILDVKLTPASLKKYSFHIFLNKSNFAFVCFFSKNNFSSQKMFTSCWCLHHGAYLNGISNVYTYLLMFFLETVNFGILDEWLEILVEWNHFLVELKPMFPILLYVTFFDNIFHSQNTHFWIHPKWRWCLILSKIIKAKYSVKELVNFIFMLPVIFMLPNVFKNLFCFAKLWPFC